MPDEPHVLTEADLLPASPPEPTWQVNRRQRRHWKMLGIALMTVVLAFVLEVHPDQRVALRGLPQYPLPPSCFSRTYLGVDCPGCGLTRSFILLAQGDLRASVARHRLGWLLALAVLLQVPYRIAKLWWPHAEVIPRHWTRAFTWLLFILLAANWVMRGFSILG